VFGQIGYSDGKLVVGLKQPFVLNQGTGRKRAVSAGFVAQEVPAIHQYFGDILEFFCEALNVADTPCQSAYEAALSATRVQVAVHVAGKVHDKRGPVVDSDPFGHRGSSTHDVDLSSLLDLAFGSGYTPLIIAQA